MIKERPKNNISILLVFLSIFHAAVLCKSSYSQRLRSFLSEAPDFLHRAWVKIYLEMRNLAALEAEVVQQRNNLATRQGQLGTSACLMIVDHVTEHLEFHVLERSGNLDDKLPDLRLAMDNTDHGTFEGDVVGEGKVLDAPIL